MPDPKHPLKIGTRGSPLALAQAHEVRDRLGSAWGLEPAAFEVVAISTHGDRVQDRSLRDLGGKGLFTGELEAALFAGAVDIAVHSTKDTAVVQPVGLVLDCFLPREDVRDAFVSPRHRAIADLPQGAVVGTSSLRRRAQLLVRRPDLQVVEFRGNVQTRLRKLNDGVAEATFLAMAGLNRLGLMGTIPAVPVPVDDLLPAVAQGAIGVERRADDAVAARLLEVLHDDRTGQCLAAERAFLAELDGSCQTPIGGLAEIDGGTLRLRGEILRTDGSEVQSGEACGAVEDGPGMGVELARDLLSRAGPGFFA
ncbi:hydroxymethylbilane synthase [Frigidibacter sp. SLM-1]|nr:hydroxymethylbilane synthase [Frigidibacter sp. ROC022]MCR8725950.1 hydroxymethylbilane synthase [Frigidibacter sp. ROC022]